MPAADTREARQSRRVVLRTGARAAYAAPLVLASVRAAPALAGTINADASEDGAETGEQQAVSNILLGLGAPSASDVSAAIAATNLYLNTFIQLTAQVVPQADWATTPIFQGAYAKASYTYSAFTFNNAIVPGYGNTLPQTTVATVQDAINYLTLIVQTQDNALTNVIGKLVGSNAMMDLRNIAAILNAAPPPRSFQTLSGMGVEEDIENGLIAISGGAFA